MLKVISKNQNVKLKLFIFVLNMVLVVLLFNNASLGRKKAKAVPGQKVSPFYKSIFVEVTGDEILEELKRWVEDSLMNNNYLSFDRSNAKFTLTVKFVTCDYEGVFNPELRCGISFRLVRNSDYSVLFDRYLERRLGVHHKQYSIVCKKTVDTFIRELKRIEYRLQ